METKAPAKERYGISRRGGNTEDDINFGDGTFLGKLGRVGNE